MPVQLNEWMSPTTIGGICTAAGVAIAKCADWLLSRRKTDSDAAAEALKLAQLSQEAAIRHFMTLIDKLREDINELRDELEESEKRRVTAEDTIRRLRDEVHSLRNELQRRGFTSPAQ